MSDSLTGHEMLNHLGQRIRVSARALRSLDRDHYLRRDRATGLLQMKPEYFQLWREMEPSSLELGRDMSGPASLECHCTECRELLAEFIPEAVRRELEREESRAYSDFEVARMIAEVKSRPTKSTSIPRRPAAKGIRSALPASVLLPSGTGKRRS